MLEIEDVDVRYGRMTAVRGARLHVATGEIVCLVGPNGAGKSTLMLTVAGALKAAAGTIRLEGRDILGREIEDVARLGVSLVPEGRHVFGGLTVEENLRLGATVRRDRAAVEQDLELVLEGFPVLRERFRGGAGKLSGGEQQQLVIARALLARPKIMLVDEPSLGLAPMMIDKVYEVLRGLRDDGMTLLIVEQSSERALENADRLYVMRSGEMVLDGATADLRETGGVESAYFGFDA